MVQAGPVPQAPEDGRIVAFGPKSTSATVVATAVPLMVDVKRGRGGALYGLAQGTWDGAGEGSPAFPSTGMLVELQGDGSVAVLAEGLNMPTSFQTIGNAAYFVSLAGEVWAIDHIGSAPFARAVR